MILPTYIWSYHNQVHKVELNFIELKWIYITFHICILAKWRNYLRKVGQKCPNNLWFILLIFNSRYRGRAQMTSGIARTDPIFWPSFVRTYLPTPTRPFYLSLSQFLTYLHRKNVILKNTTPLSPNHEVEQCTAPPYD